MNDQERPVQRLISFITQHVPLFPEDIDLLLKQSHLLSRRAHFSFQGGDDIDQGFQGDRDVSQVSSQEGAV